MHSGSNDNFGEVRKLLESRLAELDDERGRLERALTELGVKKARRPGRPPGGGKPGNRGPRTGSQPRRRRRRSGGRADQALDLIGKEPGIKTADLAKAMKLKPNYLYRVLADLEKEGRIKKQGRLNYRAG